MDHLDTHSLQLLDAAHHLHPFNDNAALAKKGTRILTRGEGVYVWDSEGNKMLDAFAGLWCVNIGYGRKELGEVASKQMTELAYYNSFFSCTTEPTVRLAAKLAELTPGDLNHVFFSNSGSEANDTILRMVRHFWAVQDKPQKNIFIGRWNGYHGSTVAGASLGGMKGMHAHGRPADPEHRPHQPALLVRRWRRLERRGVRPGSAPASWRRRSSSSAPIASPPSSASRSRAPSACIIPPMNYWPEIERICRKYDVLLVADEVICGFGRTGALVRLRIFRHPAGHHDPGQGHHLGLHPAGRGDVQRPYRRAC